MKQGPENPVVIKTVVAFKKAFVKTKKPFFKTVAELLLKSSRRAAQVNLYKINKLAKDGETIVVPGKVMSLGSISKKVTIACVSITVPARKKAETGGAKVVALSELAGKADVKGFKIIV